MNWPKRRKSNKYKNKKCLVDGILFDSKKEAKWYLYYRELLRSGVISDLKLQTKFILQENFKYNEKTERKISYIADFSYMQNNNFYVIDVKGMKTDVYKIKRKLFLFKYPVNYFY